MGDNSVCLRMTTATRYEQTLQILEGAVERHGHRQAREADVRLIGRVDKRTNGRRQTAGRSVRTVKAGGAGLARRPAGARPRSLSADIARRGWTPHSI